MKKLLILALAVAAVVGVVLYMRSGTPDDTGSGSMDPPSYPLETGAEPTDEGLEQEAAAMEAELAASENERSAELGQLEAE